MNIITVRKAKEPTVSSLLLDLLKQEGVQTLGLTFLVGAAFALIVLKTYF